MKTFFALIAFAFAFIAPAQAARVLDVQRIITPAGIEVWLAQDKSVPVISLSFSFRGGLLLDPADKPGVGRLVSILLDEGAGPLDSQTFQKQLADNAISLSFSARRDTFSGQLRTLKDKQQMAFGLLQLALGAPRFDEDALTRMKNANIAQIRDSLGDPSWLVARVFNGKAFEGHAYAAPGYGTLASMDRIAQKDLLDFAARQFTRDVLTVSIAGDIDPATAAKAVDRIFATLPAKSHARDVPLAEIKYAGKTILLPHRVPQTFISVGQRGLHHSDKLWPAAVVLNYILGGGSFDSRLMHEIREKRGLTYGVYSSLNSTSKGAIITASLSTSNESAGKALALLKEEWGKLARTPPSETEIANAKAYLTGSLLLQLTSTSSIAATLNDLQNDGFGHDYINRYADIINAVSAADIKKAAAMLSPDNLTVVLVGSPKGIKPDITLEKPPGMD